MKKAKSSIALFLTVCTLSSCATVFGGRVNTYQHTKPLPGGETRSIRPVALIADILFFAPGLIVDFATCAIYRPQPAAAASTAPATPPVKTSGTGN